MKMDIMIFFLSLFWFLCGSNKSIAHAWMLGDVGKDLTWVLGVHEVKVDMVGNGWIREVIDEL
jgi:hypothetical protein